MNQLIVGIDPGSTSTAFVVWKDGLFNHGHETNDELLDRIRSSRLGAVLGATAAIEMIGHYGTGMPAGKDVFHTCLMIGRMVEAFTAKSIPVRLILRPTIKTYLCGTPRAKDGNVAQALRDRLGEKGTKSNPGPLYGISKHSWSALAVAVYAAENGTDKDVQFTAAL